MDEKANRIRRSDRAKALRGDDVLVEAIEKAREYFRWQSIEAETLEERETARAGCKAVERVERELDIIADAGEVSREAIRRAQ